MTASRAVEALDLDSVCKSCGRRLSSSNSVVQDCSVGCEWFTTASRTVRLLPKPACRRACRRMGNPKLQAISRIERRCEACGSSIRADNVSGYCNTPDCRRVWERLRGQLRRPARREYHNNYKHGYRRANPERFALAGAKRRAKSSGVPFRLTRADLPPIPDRCPVFDTEFKYGDGRVLPESLTLDRIVPALGYVPGNVMWLSHRANAMKQDATIEELHRFARWALALH